MRSNGCVAAALLSASLLIPPAARAQIAAPHRYEAVSTPPPIQSDRIAHQVLFRPDANDRITVKVKVGGKGPYNFLVDTGADHTVISSRLAGALKLSAGERVQMYTITGDQRVKTATLGQIQFSSKTIDNVNAAVLDQAHLGADGVLGIDSLRSERVTFDFPKGLMTIVPSATIEVKPTDAETIVVTGKLRAGRLVLTQATAAGKAVSVVIDTGSDVSVGNEALRRKLERTGRLRHVGMITLQSVTGHYISGELMTLDKLNIGDVAIERMSIVFADVSVFKLLNLDDRPAILLGMNAIRAFDRVSIDFARRKFRVVLTQKSALDQVALASR